jgi:hypothetical protein
MDDFKEKDPLWELLGRSRRIGASPYFVRRVLRAIHEEKPSRFSWVALWRWLIPTAACAALVIVWATYQQDDQEAFDAYFDEAADLQSLVASEDGSMWLDEPTL